MLNITSSMLKTEESKRSGLKHVNYLTYFLKPYEGKIYRDGKFSDGLVRFYDEREWRFVPPFDVNIEVTLILFFLDVIMMISQSSNSNIRNSRITVLWSLHQNTFDM